MGPYREMQARIEALEREVAILRGRLRRERRQRIGRILPALLVLLGTVGLLAAGLLFAAAAW